MSLDSFSSIISPRSLGCQKQFEFESQDIHEYIEGLEENLYHHVALLQNLIEKYQIDSFTEDSDLGTKSPIRLDKLILDVLDLYKSLKQTQAERRKEISKILLSQLFLHEHKEKLDEITDDYEERIQEIKFHIDRRDKVIYDLQKVYNELEIQNNYKESKDETIPVGINQNILEDYVSVEEIRQSLLEMGENLSFSHNYRDFLINFYRKYWRKAQIVQALLRNPVNIKEGYGKNVRLRIENEEPELTLEFEESEIEESNHCRAFTLNSESFYSQSHKRHTLSSGKELIMAVTSKLALKVQKTEKKIQTLESKFQNLADVLYKESEENFKIQQKNCELMNEYKKITQKNFK